MAKVIIIDDEKDIRIVLKEVLERAGFEVEVASNSNDGMNLLRENGADLVVTDIIMPGKDGVQTVNEIRAEFPGTKVIVISGGGNVAPMEYEPAAIKTSAYLASASVAGADLTLTKPFDRQELVDAVKTLTAA
jgi:DNA-binding response OmpR family regulator